jgi:hypothetical protein
MNTNLRSFIIGAAGLFLTTLALQADPALLANKGLSGQSLDADTVKAVLLGKKATIGSTRVVIVIAKSGDNQEKFLKDRVGMTTDQFQTHWRRLYMTGGGTAPKVVETEADACKLAADTEGAITIGDSTKAEGLVVLADK